MVSPSAAVPIIVFDLDHTLVHCDSFSAFSRHLVLRAWWRIALVVVASPIVGVLWLPARTRVLAVSVLLWCATVGIDEKALHALMDGHTAQRFGGDSQLACRPAIEALRAHQSAGARVLVATGAEANLAERVCGALGIRGIEVVGSSLRPWLGGWVAHRHCYGSRKLSMLSEHCGSGAWECVYSDSAADLPILSRGVRRVVVSPKPADLKKISASLGQDFELVEWRGRRE